MLSVELHVHSAMSYDGRDSVDLILQQAAAVGLDAIAITDHDEIDASLEAVDRAHEYGLIGIPGMEISTAAGHLLAHGIRERIPPDLPFHETVERIHDQGGIAIVPHPFQESRHGVLATLDPEDLLVADAIEVYNSRLITGRSNRQAETFARDHGMPQTAGSDAHISEMVGQAVTRVDTEDRTAEAIIEAIRDGKTAVEGKRTPWHVSLRQAAGGAKRRARRRITSLLK